jgi:hypothetical protein
MATIRRRQTILFLAGWTGKIARIGFGCSSEGRISARISEVAIVIAISFSVEVIFAKTIVLLLFFFLFFFLVHSFNFLFPIFAWHNNLLLLST